MFSTNAGVASSAAPTFVSGPNARGAYALAPAAGTPAPLVERLNKEINEISASPELRTFLDPDGALPVALTPAAITARLKQELAQLKKIAAERKISLD